MTSINNHDEGFQTGRLGIGKIQEYSNCRIFQKEMGQFNDQAITFYHNVRLPI